MTFNSGATTGSSAREPTDCEARRNRWTRENADSQESHLLPAMELPSD
jgi:hypothetical protein